MGDPAEIKAEQAYFDRAEEHRARMREIFRRMSLPAGSKNALAEQPSPRYRRELLNIPDPAEPAAFGSFLCTDASGYYLGKNAIWDDESDLVVINWKTPAAQPFYQATKSEPGALARRRVFDARRGNRIHDYTDTHFAEVIAATSNTTSSTTSSPSEASQEPDVDDALLNALSEGRTGHMADIVRTIQASQDALIRSPLEQVLVIQGAPGSGKTAVALHRVSWLLFHHIETLMPRDILVLGPNPFFRDFIHRVLPGLGDEGVIYNDLRTLGPAASTGHAEALDTVALKGDARMAGLLRRALAQEVSLPKGEGELPFTFSNERSTERAWVRRDLLETAISDALARGSYNAARAEFRNFLELRASEQEIPGDRKLDERQMEAIWPNRNAKGFLRALLGSRARLSLAAGDEFTAADVSRLYRRPSAKISEEAWTDADVALLCEAEYLIDGNHSGFKHIVIDEAQELSPMQALAVRRRSATGSYTLVGDLAQSTGVWPRSTWSDLARSLASDLPLHIEELTVNYRIPARLFALATRILPDIAPALTAPTSVVEGDTDPESLLVTHSELPIQAAREALDAAARGYYVGIIAEAGLRENIMAMLAFIDRGSGSTSKKSLINSIEITTAADSKGREFDAVVIVDPASMATSRIQDWRQLYVALTRATKEMCLIFGESDEGSDGAPTRGSEGSPTTFDELVDMARLITRPGSATFPESVLDSIVAPIAASHENVVAAASASEIRTRVESLIGGPYEVTR